MVVTVDGPAGAGKSSVSRRLAAELGFAYLDTGALYRAVALAAMEEGLDLEDAAAVEAWLPALRVTARPEGGRFAVLLAGRDVEPLIRNERVAAAASSLSAQPAVRARLLGLQRGAGAAGDLVAEGRDMGTVVFPAAEAKFFLTASPEERARRRFLELAPQRPELGMDEVLEDMARRDARDAARAASPLTPAHDAEIVDTSALDEAQVLALLVRKVRERRRESA